MDTQANTTQTETQAAAQTAGGAKLPNTVNLESPIVRGNTRITELQLRKPRAGELRGINLAELLNMRTEALLMLLPRITSPTLARHEVDAMDPVDIVSVANEVIGFFVPAQRVEQIREAQEMARESLSE